MNRKKATGITILLFAALILYGYVVTQPVSSGMATETIPTTISPDNPVVKAQFDNIHEVPYKAVLITPVHADQMFQRGYGDCDDKALAFAEYLTKMGEKNIGINIVTQKYLNQKINAYTPEGQGHMYVIWRNKAYDPTNGLYGVDPDKYYQTLLKDGFNGYYIQEGYCEQLYEPYKPYQG